MTLQEFIHEIQSINIYRWIFIGNNPWLLSIRSSNYIPSPELNLQKVQASKCDGQSGILTLQTNLSSNEDENCIKNNVNNLSNKNYIESKEFDKSTKISNFALYSHSLNPATTFLSINNSPIDVNKQKESLSSFETNQNKTKLPELQLIFTNNQNLIYSCTMNYYDLDEHRKEIYSRSDIQWKDYFSVILDPTCKLIVDYSDDDLWLIRFIGDSTNIDSSKDPLLEVKDTNNDISKAMHIKFEYELCKLVNEEMRREAMQYLLFSLVGMIETQQYVIYHLESTNRALIKENESLKNSKSNSESQNDSGSLPEEKKLAPLNLKNKRKRPNELFRQIKKTRGAVIV